MESESRAASEPIEIVLAEDSAVQAMALRRLLERRGCQVRVAENGEQALELVRQRPPHLVISDIVMPEMDGYELCTAIKRSRSLKEVPIILLTSMDDPEDIIKGLNAGADNYLTKPCDEQVLMGRIEQLLQNQDLRRGLHTGSGVEVYYARRKHSINSDRKQILDLLISTFENGLHKNRELVRRTEELEDLRRELQERARRAEAAAEKLGEVRDSLDAIAERCGELSERARERECAEIAQGMEGVRLAARHLLRLVEEMQ